MTNEKGLQVRKQTERETTYNFYWLEEVKTITEPRNKKNQGDVKSAKTDYDPPE